MPDFSNRLLARFAGPVSYTHLDVYKRQVINMHSGEIIVRSVEGEYCEFQFTLKTANARNSQNLLKNEKEKNRPQGE